MEPVSNFNWIDIVAGIILIRIFYISVQKGFIVEFFKVFGTFVSLFFSYHFYIRFSVFLSRFISFFAGDIGQLLIFIFLFFFIYILFRYIRVILTLLFKIEPHYVIERWFSLVLGVVRGLLFLSLLFFVMNMSGFKYIRKSLKGSMSYPYIKRVVPFTYQVGFNVYKYINSKAQSRLGAGS